MHQTHVGSIFRLSHCRDKKRVSGWISLYFSVTVSIVPVLIFLLLVGCGEVGSGSSVDGHLLIVGGSTVQPFVQSAALLFQQKNPSAHIDIQGSGSAVGL